MSLVWVTRHSPITLCHWFQMSTSKDGTFGGVYVPCINSHARWSYRRLFTSLLLCPLSVERSYPPPPFFVYSLTSKAIWISNVNCYTGTNTRTDVRDLARCFANCVGLLKIAASLPLSVAQRSQSYNDGIQLFDPRDQAKCFTDGWQLITSKET